MIKKFGSLFAGHVDMDSIGLEGTPANDRRYSNEYLATVFQKAEVMAQTMDRLGFDDFWMAEHHFQHEGYECIPNILQLAVHLAHVTSKIKVGCGFNVTPMWHPLRLAEDYATADILTGGRVIFGVGRGYHTREVEVFGAPMLDADANRDMFEEQVDIIFKAFNEESFSHRGNYYNIPAQVPYRGYELEKITLVPRPVNLPVECWQPIVSANQRGLDFMVKHGIKGIIGGGAAVGGAAEKVIHRWRDAISINGREAELGEDLIIGFSCFLGETREKAINEARKYFQEHMKMFGPLGFVKLSDDQLESLIDPRKAITADLPTIEDAVDNVAWLCGPPDLIVEQLMDIQERYPGLNQVNIGNSVGMPQSVIVEQLEWFAQDVMPAFKK